MEKDVVKMINHIGQDVELLINIVVEKRNLNLVT